MNRNDKNRDTQGKEYAKNKNDFFYYHDQTYLELVEDVLENGVFKGDRTGTGTYSVFGRQMHFQLDNGTIPLLTTKKMHTRSVIHEILWYLQGSTNVKYLQDNGVRIWNEWADENGDLGPIYGYQWRNWPKPVDAKVDYNTDPPHCDIQYEYIDQVAEVIDKLMNNPTDRRIIISAWNVGQLENMALPPCHAFFQFWVNVYTFDQRWKQMEKVLGQETADHYREQMSMGMLLGAMEEHGIPRGELSCQLYQRSCDVGLGVPFNIVQYSILTHMFAHVTNLKAKEFIWTGGDVHIYTNHIEALKEQITRKPYISPKLKLNPDVKDIDGFSFEDFEIVDYYSHPTIKMEVSV